MTEHIPSHERGVKMYPSYMSHYQPLHVSPYLQYPQYPQSEMLAEQQIKKPLYPHMKQQTLNFIDPFVKYGLKEAKYTSFEHALQEVAAMTYLLGKGIDPQTAYLIVESWEINEMF